jgi:hypothetical protein
MRFFAELCPAAQIGQQAADQLPWFHIVVLLTKVSAPVEREWYAAQAIEQAWSRATLEAHIKSHLYLRQGAALTNFEQRLVTPHALARSRRKIAPTKADPTAGRARDRCSCATGGRKSMTGTSNG